MPQEGMLHKKSGRKRSSLSKSNFSDYAMRIHNLVSNCDCDKTCSLSLFSEKGDSVLPQAFQSRLNDLFNQIEKEFEALYLENLTCKLTLENICLTSAIVHEMI
jgi:hypothetical protein